MLLIFKRRRRQSSVASVPPGTMGFDPRAQNRAHKPHAQKSASNCIWVVNFVGGAREHRPFKQFFSAVWLCAKMHPGEKPARDPKSPRLLAT